VLALSAEVSAPLNPRPVEPAAPPLTAADLVPPRGPAPAAPPGLDASQQFRQEVSNAVAVVAQVCGDFGFVFELWPSHVVFARFCCRSTRLLCNACQRN
jgi:hypothetical protein